MNKQNPNTIDNSEETAAHPGEKNESVTTRNVRSHIFHMKNDFVWRDVVYQKWLTQS